MTLPPELHVPRAPDAWDRKAEGSTYTPAFRAACKTRSMC